MSKNEKTNSNPIEDADIDPLAPTPMEQPEEQTSLSAEEQIHALLEELLQAKDRTMRALADAENTRKRAIKDREDAGKFAIASFARDLLSFSDNFKRAIEAIPEDIKHIDPRMENLIEGIEAMGRELGSVFDRHGIRKIEPIDEMFDPNYHEVMFEAPMPDKQPGIIIQVVEPGYVISDRLLRAAKVGVAKAGVAPAGPTEPGSKVDIQG